MNILQDNRVVQAYMRWNLPLELVYHILDCLHDDNDTLRSCALVHSTWLSGCYSHLFRHYIPVCDPSQWLITRRQQLDRKRCTTIDDCLKRTSNNPHTCPIPGCPKSGHFRAPPISPILDFSGIWDPTSHEIAHFRAGLGWDQYLGAHFSLLSET